MKQAAVTFNIKQTSFEQSLNLEESMDQISEFVKGGIDSFIVYNSVA